MSAFLANLIAFLALGGYCICLPGYLMARRWVKPRGRIETVAYSLGLGASVVSFVGYATGMLTHQFVRRELFLICATAINALLYKEALRAAKEFSREKALKWLGFAKSGRAVAFVFIACAVFGFSLVHFDVEQLHLTCINYRVARSMGIGMTDEAPWTSNEVISLAWDSRGGAPMEIAIFTGLFDFAGFRFSYAFTQTFIFLFTFLLAERMFQSRLVGIIAGLALALLGPAIGIREIDQSLIPLGISAMLFALMFRGGWPPFLSGILFGIIFNCEHLMLISLPAFLYLWRAERRSWICLFKFLAAFAAVGSVEGMNHLAAFGHFFYYEFDGADVSNHYTNVIRGNFEHRLPFFKFHLETMLNWPFIDRVVRSPYNPFPTFLLFPLYYLKQYGIVCGAIAISGLGNLLLRHRRTAIALLLYSLPYFGLLQFQENWSDVEKFRLGLLFLMVPGVCFAAGAAGLLKGPWRPLQFAATAGLCAALFYGVQAVRPMKFPADERLYVSVPNLKPETPDEIAIERDFYTKPIWAPLSAKNAESMIGDLFSAAKIASEISRPRFEQQPAPFMEVIESLIEPELYRRVFNPQFGWNLKNRSTWMRRPAPAREESERRQKIRVDLSKQLVGRKDWLQVVEGNTQAAQTLEWPKVNEVQKLKNIEIPWADNRLDVTLAHLPYGEERIAFLILSLRRPDYYDTPPVKLPGFKLDLEIGEDAALVPFYLIHTRPAVTYGWETKIKNGQILMGVPSRE